MVIIFKILITLRYICINFPSPALFESGILVTGPISHTSFHAPFTVNPSLYILGIFLWVSIGPICCMFSYSEYDFVSNSIFPLFLSTFQTSPSFLAFHPFQLHNWHYCHLKHRVLKFQAFLVLKSWNIHKRAETNITKLRDAQIYYSMKKRKR